MQLSKRTLDRTEYQYVVNSTANFHWSLKRMKKNVNMNERMPDEISPYVRTCIKKETWESMDKKMFNGVNLYIIKQKRRDTLSMAGSRHKNTMSNE